MAPYLTPDEVRDRCGRLSALDDAVIERHVQGYEEVVVSHWGKDFRPVDELGEPTADPLPENLLRGCVEYVACVSSADESGTSRDIIAQSADGSWTRFSTPDPRNGRPTGWTEVDRLIVGLEGRIPGIA